jgi:hypothetical protein
MKSMFNLMQKTAVALGLASALAAGATSPSVAAPLPTSTLAVRDANPATTLNVRWRGGPGPWIVGGLLGAAAVGAYGAYGPYGYPGYGYPYARPYAYYGPGYPYYRRPYYRHRYVRYGYGYGPGYPYGW